MPVTFTFKSMLDYIEQSLIDSIRELKKSKKIIKTETSLYIFGLALSSFLEDNVTDMDISDKSVQNRLLDALKLGWTDGITKEEKQATSPKETAPQQPVETPPEQQTMLGGAPAGQDNLGTLPMPPSGNAPNNLTGGQPPNPNNPNEEPPETLEKSEKKPEDKFLNKTEKFDFRDIKQRFLNESKFNGMHLKV